jgi:hypothetical protein
MTISPMTVEAAFPKLTLPGSETPRLGLSALLRSGNFGVSFGSVADFLGPSADLPTFAQGIAAC